MPVLELIPQYGREFAAAQIFLHLRPDSLMIISRDPGYPFLLGFEADHQAVGGVGRRGAVFRGFELQ